MPGLVRSITRVQDADDFNASTIADLRHPHWDTPNGKLVFADPHFVDAVADYAADPTGATYSTTALAAAFAKAVAAGWRLYVPLGTYKVDTTSGVLFPITGLRQFVLEGDGAGNVDGTFGSGGWLSTVSGTRFYRAAGSNPIITITGVSNSTRCRARVAGCDFNGGGLTGDVAVVTRGSELNFDDVRFSNTAGRGLRLIQTWNSRYTKCYFYECGAASTSLTATWSNGGTSLAVTGTIPPNCDNLPIYGLGIPAGTNITNVSGSTITISAAATAAGTGAPIRIGHAPAVSLEGLSDATLGGSSTNHFVGCEWEDNNGSDIDLAGSADGVSPPVRTTMFVACKQERQVAANSAPVIFARYADGVMSTGCSWNAGGSAAQQGALLTSGSAAATLTGSNASIAVGQMISGAGVANTYHVRANYASGVNTITVLDTSPLAGVGPLTTAAVAVGQIIRGAGIPAATTVTSVTTTTIGLSANTTAAGAGERLSIGGAAVSAVSGTSLTLDANATSTQTAPMTFGGTKARLLEIPSWGYATGTFAITGGWMQHAGNPDFHISQLAGVVTLSGVNFRDVNSNLPTAYWRVGPSIDDEAVRWSAVHWDTPTRTVADERAAGGFKPGGAYDTRRLPVDAYNANVTANNAIGSAFAYKLPHGSTGTLVANVRVPPNFAKGASLVIRVTYSAVVAHSTNVKLQLGWIRLIGGTDMSGQAVTVATSPTVAIAGGSAQDMALTAAAVGGSLAPGTEFQIQFSRLGADAADTETGDINVIDLTAFWIKSA